MKNELNERVVKRFKAYPDYKDSRIGWLGVFPRHWDLKPLKHVVTHNDEILPEGTAPDFVMQYVDISSVDLTNGIQKIEEYEFEKAPSRARRKVRAGDTIISTVRTYLKAIAPIKSPPKNMIVSTGFAVIRPRLNILDRYLTYQMQSEGFIQAVVANSVGVSYPAINPSILVTLPALIPSMQEQQAISNFLDQETARIDELIAKKQWLIDLLQEKRTALISQAVTKGLNPNAPMKDSGIDWLGEIPSKWIVCKLGFISTAIQTGPFGSQLHSHEYVDDEIPVINPTNLINGKIVPDPKATVSKEVYERLKRHELKNGDIVFGRRGEMGRCSLVSEKESGWLCGTGSLLVRPKQSIVKPSYLTAFLSTTGVSEFLSLRSVGSTMENLNSKILGSIPVCLPSIEEQEEIDCFIQIESGKHENLIQKIQNAISVLIEYRSSLISAAVTGKIDVRHLANESVTV